MSEDAHDNQADGVKIQEVAATRTIYITRDEYAAMQGYRASEDASAATHWNPEYPDGIEYVFIEGDNARKDIAELWCIFKLGEGL